MSVLVSFLIITKFSIVLTKYYEVATFTSNMFQSTREMVHYACALTEADPGRAQWRSDMAYLAMLLMRTTVAMMEDHGEDSIHAWEIPQLEEAEKKYLTTFLPAPTDSTISATEKATRHTHNWRHNVDADNNDLNLTVPIRMAFRLKRKIANSGLDVLDRNQLLIKLDNFMNGYYGVRRYLTIPLPFPLIQMSRIFLYAYVFSLPLALPSVLNNLYQGIILVFIVSYGFLGMEMICIELHDPFGDDPCDLPCRDQAKSCYDDIFLAIMDTDGVEAAKELRRRMHPRGHSVPAAGGEGGGGEETDDTDDNGVAFAC